MSFTTDPTAKTDPTNNQGKSFLPHDPSTMGGLAGKGGSTRTLPSSARSRSRLVPFAIGGILLFAVATLAGWFFFLRPAPARADVLLHNVKREPLIVSVTEKGTLESADNRDIVCKVRAGNKGFATSINWVIDDGSRVNPGQLLMILDDSALRDQEETQRIAVDTALSAKVTAEKDYDIMVKANEASIALAEQELTNATNTLINYTGLAYDPSRAAFGAIGGGPFMLSEAGLFRQSADDQGGQVRLAESAVEQNRERAAWADRMVKLAYMSAAQSQAEKSRLDSSIEDLRSKRAKLAQLINNDRNQVLTQYVLACRLAQIKLDQATLTAEANLVKTKAALQSATSVYMQQDDRLRDILQQRAECKIVAPEGIEPGSLVVYYKSETSRFRSTNEGMIEQGAQVKEGQKLLRIPNLHRMQVNTKIHEAMVARLRGDVRVPTHIVDTFQCAMLFNTSGFGRVISQRQEVIDRIHEKYRNYEYETTSPGQKATIRVDALPDRTFLGHVRIVANVASQADSWISDVKLYQTVVMIDAEVMSDGSHKSLHGEILKPDMTAEVTITVDTAKEPVLTVPVQAVIGGTEMGAKREIYVKTPTGYERQQITLGIYNDKVVEIREGLSEGDEVVLNPKVLLAPDDKTRTRDNDGKAGPGGTKGGKGGGKNWDGGAGGSGGPKGPGAGGGPGGNKGGGKGKRGNGGGGGGGPSAE